MEKINYFHLEVKDRTGKVYYKFNDGSLRTAMNRCKSLRDMGKDTYISDCCGDIEYGRYEMTITDYLARTSKKDWQYIEVEA